MRLTSKILALILGFALWSGFNGQAAAQDSLTDAVGYDRDLFNRDIIPPEVTQIPLLDNMIRSGAKLHYMGERSGIYGWLLVKDGQIQMVYATADKKTVLIGGMFSHEGVDVTAPQITALSRVDKEVADLVNGASNAQTLKTAGVGVGGIAGSAPLVPASPVASAASSPGEQLLQDLQFSSGVTVGKNDAVQMQMVISPNCPYCQATWRELRDIVAKNQLQIHLVPIDNQGDDARAAGQLLAAQNPFEAWDKWVNGDKSALAGEPSDAQKRAVQGNYALIGRWHIQSTPYIVYRGKDGHVKIVQGKPDRIAAVLSDLIR